MVFKKWLTDLTKIQGVVNNIKNVSAIVDGATGLLNPNVVNSLSASINGLNLQQAQLALSTKNLTQEQMNQVLVQAGLIASENQIQAELVQSALAQSGLSAEKQKAILNELKLIDGTTGEILTTKACTKEKLLEVLATKGVTGANAEAIISALGLSSANEGLSFSFEVLSASIKQTMVALAMNPMTWIMAIPAIISIATKAFDALTDSAEEVTERVDSLMSSYKSALDEANSNAETVEGLADRYEELSKGVNGLGKNISLTTDEYSEYNDIVNQIADMFPTLIQGYTDEGTAILSLKGNVEELRDAYKEAQQEAYNTLISSGEDGDGNDIIENWNNLSDSKWYDKAFDGWFGDPDVGKSITYSEALDWMQEIANMTADEYREKIDLLRADSTADTLSRQVMSLYTGNYSGLILSARNDFTDYSNFINNELGLKLSSGLISSDFSDEEFAQAKRNAQALVQTYQAEIDSRLNDVRSLANAYLMTNDDYELLEENSKTLASLIVNGIDEDIADEFEKKSDVGAYVNDILDKIKDHPEIEEALNNLFTTDFSKIPLSDAKLSIDNYINTIADALYENPLELKVMLGFETYDEYQKDLDQIALGLSNPDPNNILNYVFHGTSDYAVTGNHGGGGSNFSGNILSSIFNSGLNSDGFYGTLGEDYSEYKEKITAFADQYSINTQEEIAALQAALEKAEGDIDKAFEYYIQDWSANKRNQSLGITEFEQLLSSPALKETRDRLIELSQLNIISEENISSLEGYNELLEACGGQVSSLMDNINEYAQTSSTAFSTVNNMDNIQDGLGLLSDVYADKMDGDGFVAPDLLSNLYSQFGNLSGFDNFISKMLDVKSTAEETQDAFDELATQYIDTNYNMQDLTSEDAEYVEQAFTKLGVAEAHEAVTERLNAVERQRASILNMLKSSEQTSAIAKKYNITTSEDLANATYSEITAFANELQASGADVAALRAVALEKKGVNATTITTTTDISQLLELANVAGLSSASLNMLESVKKGQIRDATSAETIVANAKEEILRALNSFSINYDYKFTGTPSSSSPNSSSGSPGSSSDTSKSTIDWIDRRLTRIQKKVEKIKTTISHWFDFKQKNTRLDKSIKLLESSMSTQEKAYEEYMSEAYVYYAKIKKEFGEEYAKKIASLVRDGGINISEYSGEGAEWIQSLMDYYDKAQDALDARQESLDAIYEANQQKLENITTYYDSYKSYTESLIDLQESMLDFGETSGKSMVSTDQLNIYTTQKSLYEKELAQVKKEYADYKAELDSQYKSGYITTEDYNAGLKYLKELNTEANKLYISIAETQKAINEIDFKKIEIALDKTSRSASAISEAIDLATAKNSRITGSDTMTVNGEEKTVYSYYQDQLIYIARETANYQKQIEWYKKQLKTVEENSQDWIDWTEAVADAESAINQLYIDREGIYDDMIQLILNGYDEIADKLSNYRSVLSGLSELLTDDMLLKDDGLLTDYGVTKIAMLSREYKTASSSLKNYAEELNRIDAMYEANAAGYSDEEDYLEDRQEAIENIISSMSDMQSLTSELISLRKSQYDKELAALDKVIDARKEAYDKKKEYYDYDKSIRSKTKDIQSLEAQIAAIEATGDSLEKRKQLLELQQELNDAQTELAETRTEHTYNIIIDGLDEFRDDLSDSYDTQIAYLKSSFEAQNSVIEEVTGLWDTCGDLVNNVIGNIGKAYGANISVLLQNHMKDTLIRLDPGDLIPVVEPAGLALATVDTMPELVQLPDYTSIPVKQNDSIICEPQININIAGNADQSTIMDLKTLVPTITKQVTKEVVNDLHKSGW